MRRSGLERKIAGLIEPALNGMGYVLVSLEFSGGVLQIMAEKADEGHLSLDDCAAISRAISPLMEVEDPIESAYRLEVSSPGIDRPLNGERDFARFIGKEARVELDDPLSAEDGQKRFKGAIGAVKDGTVILTTEQGERVIPIHLIAKAKLAVAETLFAGGKKKTKPTKTPKPIKTQGKGR